ncbi:SEC14-like protein 4 [Orchesella cincta]|uniref:SEC14-like protein 4 n=1 Tax=Orchesella cincta TaxID=48709 RepID=A0A1D2NIR4_ORCCI|nr:SEC14-like protein 4 [Orchesella cincta]
MAAPTLIELEILAKFQDKLKDLNFDGAKDTQMFLMRFLRARNHNLTKAEDMLRKHLEWRAANHIDSLLNWTPPKALIDEYKYDVAGFDKQGCPILIAPFGTWDVRRVCENGLKQEYVKYVDQLFLHVTQAMKESSVIRGTPITQFICIMVPDEFPAFRQMSSPQAVDTVLETVRRFEANYPETLKCAFVVDAPKVFNLIFNVIKPLLNSTTLGKVTISSNEKEWKSALLNLIDEDQLCARLGGSRPSRVPILNAERGAYKSPKNKESIIVEDQEGFLAVTIGAGQTFKLQQDVEKDTSQICWTFKTDSHDIGFSITLEDSNKEVVQYSRVNSHVEPHVGAFRCEKSGNYTLVFDNTFSRFRSKVLRYKVVVEDGSKGNMPASTNVDDDSTGNSSGNNSDVESTSL